MHVLMQDGSCRYVPVGQDPTDPRTPMFWVITVGLVGVLVGSMAFTAWVAKHG